MIPRRRRERKADQGQEWSDPLSQDWGQGKKAVVVLLPLAIVLLAYGYCALFERDCNPETRLQSCSTVCFIVYRTLHDVVGLFTAVLAYVVYVQVLLMFSQEKWLRRAYKTAAFANTLALDTSISTHRPQIRAKHVFLMSDIWEGERIKIELAIVNTGINTARIIECNVATLVLPVDRELPQIPPFGAGAYVPSHPFLPGGKTYVLPNRWETKVLTDEENGQLRSGNAKLYCFGYVDYSDLSGKVLRKTAFARVLRLPRSPGSYQDIGRFVKLEPENTDYEYSD